MKGVMRERERERDKESKRYGKTDRQDNMINKTTCSLVLFSFAVDVDTRILFKTTKFRM